jgi:Zn-dependent peptidase ImmA (M78 family)
MATNMAYEVLSECEVFSLPIYIRGILKKYPDIQVYSYAEASNKYGATIDVFLESSDHGFTIIQNGDYKILYNGDKDTEIIRFTLAHELGHYILCHTVDDEVSAREANCFARNILCPIPVIRKLQMQTVNDYMNLFAVSETNGIDKY